MMVHLGSETARPCPDGREVFALSRGRCDGGPGARLCFLPGEQATRPRGRWRHAGGVSCCPGVPSAGLASGFSASGARSAAGPKGFGGRAEIPGEPARGTTLLVASRPSPHVGSSMPGSWARAASECLGSSRSICPAAGRKPRLRARRGLRAPQTRGWRRACGLDKATAPVLRVSAGRTRPWRSWAGLCADSLPRGVRAAVPWPPAWEMLACSPGSRLVGALPAGLLLPRSKGLGHTFPRGWEPNS